MRGWSVPERFKMLIHGEAKRCYKHNNKSHDAGYDQNEENRLMNVEKENNELKKNLLRLRNKYRNNKRTL